MSEVFKICQGNKSVSLIKLSGRCSIYETDESKLDLFAVGWVWSPSHIPFTGFNNLLF